MPAPLSPVYRRRAGRLLALGLCLLLCACNLQDNSAETAPRAATSPPAGPPRITILSPAFGAEFAIGEEILVAVEAEDSIGVNRVQLFVDDQIVRTVSSESLQGDLAMSAILNYETQRADLGRITLRALAYRGIAVSAPDEIQVLVRESRAQVRATPAQGSGIPAIPNDGICRALVNVGLNFRTGPSTGYRILTVLPSGTLALITGRNSAYTWWRLDVDGSEGWVSGGYTTEYGDCSGVAVVAG